MRLKLAHFGEMRSPYRAATCSVACLAFVIGLAIAFWAGVAWVAAGFLGLIAGGF
jgi:hypothetical protein